MPTATPARWLWNTSVMTPIASGATKDVAVPDSA